MSKWLMRGHFGHLHFKKFPMTSRTPECKVFWPLQFSSEFSGVLEDSNFPLLEVWVSSSHLTQSGVATNMNGYWYTWSNDEEIIVQIESLWMILHQITQVLPHTRMINKVEAWGFVYQRKGKDINWAIFCQMDDPRPTLKNTIFKCDWSWKQI